MSTSDKLIYLNGTKQALKESINNLGGDITSETTFREYAQELDNIYDNLPKTTGEGTNLSLNTIKGKMNIIPKGDTQQNGTPTPSTPIDVEVVTGEQEVKVRNAQLIDFSTLGNSNTSSSFNNDILTVSTNSGTYANAYKDITNLYKNNAGKVLRFDFSSISYDVTPNVRIVGIRVTSGGTNSNITLVDNNKNISTHTIPNDVSNITQVTLTIYANNTNTVVTNTLTINKPILHLGSTQIAYQPYMTPITKKFSLGDIELCKIGNYQDYLYKSGEKWYKKQVIGKKVLNGSENWVTRGGGTSYAYAVNGILEQNASNGICNYWQFIVGGASNNQQNECMASANTTTTLCIFTNNASLNSVANLKTWLGTHTPTLYYNLQTTQDIEITNETLIEQLNNLEKMKSYNGITNISSSGNLPFIISASALKGES